VRGFYTLKEFREHLGRQQPWLIDGLVSSTVNILKGREKVGKSHLVNDIADHLLSSADSYLGRRVFPFQGKVAIASLDPGAGFETCDRFEAMQRDYGDRLQLTNQLPIDNVLDPYDWATFADELREDDVRLFILDNLLAAVAADADVNSGSEVAPFLRGITLMCNKGVAVLVVAHTGKGGSTSVLGSTAFQAHARHLIELRSRKGVLSLAIEGNGVEPISSPVHLNVCRGAGRFYSRDGSEAMLPEGVRGSRGENKRRASQQMWMNRAEAAFGAPARHMAAAKQMLTNGVDLELGSARNAVPTMIKKGLLQDSGGVYIAGPMYAKDLAKPAA
jgi:hypothetical protein